MEKLHFTININAPKQKVWDTMLQDKTYREWTTAFHAGSYYEGSWDTGSKILFLAEDKGKLSGMVSKVVENKPYEFISLEHLGEVQDGVEDTASERVKKWAGAHENYTLSETDGVTMLSVDLDSPDEFSDMFNGMWPKGLQKLKEIAEGTA